MYRQRSLPIRKGQRSFPFFSRQPTNRFCPSLFSNRPPAKGSSITCSIHPCTTFLSAADTAPLGQLLHHYILLALPAALCAPSASAGHHSRYLVSKQYYLLDSSLCYKPPRCASLALARKAWGLRVGFSRRSGRSDFTSRCNCTAGLPQ